jgi:DNA modification methylase
MDQKAVMVDMGDWRHSRLKNLSATDRVRDESRVRSGFGKKVENWVGREKAYPTNVLHLATECNNKGHSATFPVALPTWFINVFTRPGDLVLDPFSGSGTTAIAAKKLGRQYLGIEINNEYVDYSRKRLEGTVKSKPSADSPA